MPSFFSHLKSGSNASRTTYVVAPAAGVLAFFILFLGSYLTTGSRYICLAADRWQVHSQSVANSVNSYTRSCATLAASSNVRTLAEEPSPYVSDIFSNGSNTMQELISICSVLPDDCTVGVYFPNIQLSVTKSQYKFSTKLEHFFSVNFPGLPIEDCLSQETGSWYSAYADDFCYVVRYMRDEDGIVNAYIVVSFPAKSVFLTDGDEIPLISDDLGNVYSSINTHADIDYNDLSSSLSGNRQINVAGRHYYVVGNVFSGISLRFYTLVPMASKNVIIARLLCLAAAILVLIIPVFLYRRNRKRLLTENRQASSLSKTDNRYILHGLARSLLDVQSDRNNMYSQKFYEQLHFAPEEISIVCGFALMEDQQKLFDQTVQSADLKPITPYFILNNMLQDLLFDKHTGCLCYCDRKYIVVCNLLADEHKENLSSVFQQIAKSAEKYLCLSFVVADPIECSGYTNFHASITNVSNQLDHKRLWWHSEKLCSIPQCKKEEINFFSQLGLLNSCILEGNYLKAEDVFNAVLENCIPSDIHQVKNAETRLQMLLGALLSLTGYPRDDLPEGTYPPKTVAQCREAGVKILRKQITSQENACLSPTKDRIRAIAAYVDENYSDPDLGVGTIAVRFGLNTAYLSRTFKDEIGCNLLEYIHKARIAAAKQLLQKNSVKEVSSLVGFGDVQSFIRVFKKYETISPAEYKRTCCTADVSLPK